MALTRRVTNAAMENPCFSSSVSGVGSIQAEMSRLHHSGAIRTLATRLYGMSRSLGTCLLRRYATFFSLPAPKYISSGVR